MRAIRRVSGPVLALALALSAPLAQETGYVGVSVGSATVEADIEIDELDASDTGYKIFGGYRFMENFGLEAAWVDLGKQEDESLGANLSTEIRGFNVDGVGVVPVSERFEVFGKAGLYFAETTIFTDGGLSPQTSEETKAALSLGVGLAFKLKHVGFRAEAEFFDVERTNAVYLISVGVEYRF